MQINVPDLVLLALLWLMPACPTEDSIMCGWDASGLVREADGNGRGRAFIALTEALVLR